MAKLSRCMPIDWACLASSVLLAACGGDAGGSGSTPFANPGFVATSISDALDYGVNNGLDGVWVYLDDGAGTPQFAAAGKQDRSTLEPASLTGLFKIASVSKMFIAVGTVRLVDNGTVRLNDTIAFWLPALAGRIDNGDTITVRHLLQHRSGVPDFDSQPGFSWQQSHTDVDALLELVLDRPADFAPNARYEYSNTNYLLIGRILDTALGYSHHDFIQNEILSPLGMVDSYSLLADTDVSRLIRGYWGNVDRTEQDYIAPGGSMISTAADVGMFVRALADGTLQNAAERQTYMNLFGRIGHSGWLPGYQSFAYHHRDTNVVLVQFVNTTGSDSEAVAQAVHDSLVEYVRRR